MILDIIDKYSDIIAGYDILKFKIVGKSYQLICRIELRDTTLLFVRDYLFPDGSRKYSFRWQYLHEGCILRWDNAPHHQNIATFPYHKHIGKEERIEASQPVKLETVLEYIRSVIEKR